MNRWVDVCCTTPAKMFGLYPYKGTIIPGADADVVLFDPEKTVTLSKDLLHENVDYTPYEGFQLQGYPVTTLLRGNIIIQDGQFIDHQRDGRFIKCQLPILG